MIIGANETPFNEAEIALFDSQYMGLMGQLAAFATEKKRLEELEKKVKGQLEAIMDEHDIKSIDNRFLTITRVAAGADSVTVDLKAFEAREPEEYAALLKDYPKTVKGKAGYVRFTVKK